MGETVNGLPVAVLVVLAGGALVVAVWLAMRFGRIVGLAVLILGILVVAVLGAVALTGQSAANYQISRAATEAAGAAKAASVGQAGAMLCIGGLGTLALVSAGAAAVFYARWQLADQRRSRLGAPAPGLSSYRPHRQTQQRPPVSEIVYLATDNDDDLADFARWGW